MTRSISLILLIGCAPGASDGCGPNEDPITEPPDSDECDLSIDETWPEEGQSIYHRADLEFFLSDPDPDMTPGVALADEIGDIPGETWFSEDQETVYFTPAAPLDPLTAHTATITTCRGDASVTFGTSELGQPLEVDVTGQTWAVALTQGRVLRPENVGDLIFELGVPPVLVEVQQVDDNLELLGALALEDGTQDLCTPTIPFPSADFGENPYFEVPASLVTLDVAGVLLPVHEFVLEGTIAPDGTWFGGAIIGGELDARELADLFSEVDGPDELCNLTASFGAPCEPCTTDQATYCLGILVDRLIGEGVDIDLVEVLDPSADPDCVR